MYVSVCVCMCVCVCVCVCTWTMCMVCSDVSNIVIYSCMYGSRTGLGPSHAQHPEETSVSELYQHCTLLR